MTDVSLRESEPSDDQRKSHLDVESEFKKPLEEFQLRFTFDDGHITHICPLDNDPVWSVNLKRGVLSGMKNTMTRFDVSSADSEVLQFLSYDLV